MATVNQLIEAFALNGVKIIPVTQNPYLGKTPADPGQDDPIVRDSDYNLLGTSLGNPVYTNLTILSGSYTDDSGRVITYPRIDLEGILMTVSLPRNVVKTEIQGRNGSVKEYIGEGDAAIGINGIITGLNGQYPEADITQFLQVIMAPVALQVVSPYLQRLGIYSIVFEDRDINQTSGGYSYQTFSLNAISDTPQELLVNGM